MPNYTSEELAEALKNNPQLGVVVTKLGKQAGKPSESHPSAKSKYRAVRTEYNGRNYPSKKQAADAAKFYMLKDAGKIKGVLEEVPFRLPGKTIHRIDFGIIELNNTVTWYESKGRDLPMGKLKRRQVEALYKIKVNVI